ncbi:ABC transporter ATP-binding protein [Acanthopleuribacter pedis]|uniref:ABC transporter ATP-binding protein n=1 Tax=Acanthopleuribacter pedis TaxID=442870 RepID=A0A8J7Q9Y5_9BACT|nr:ABC transporter ATP-binding protein [Acanthopleuribacter pedis]MBO1320487.1 ABC transporter ATP-binding protein [Acanthopleuribacter pedis]
MRVEVHHLVRAFGATRAVDDLTFTIESGKIYGFVGPNGAGKTTTMRIMATLDLPNSGDIFIDGYSVVREPEKVRPLIGFMPDSLPAHRDITVAEYLDFFARLHGLRQPERAQTLKAVEAFTGVGPIRHKLPANLSKGMKQRVSLARALVQDPQFLILDEPAAGLDPKARIELRELILALAAQGKTLFISSHILGELTEICDGTVMIEQGRLLQAGTMDHLLAKHHDEVRYWLGNEGDTAVLYEHCMGFPGVTFSQVVKDEVEVHLHKEAGAAAALLQHLLAQGVVVNECRRRRAGLEDMFLEMTRGQLQ